MMVLRVTHAGHADVTNCCFVDLVRNVALYLSLLINCLTVGSFIIT